MKVKSFVAALMLCLTASMSWATTEARFFVNQAMDGQWENFTTALTNHGHLKDGYIDTRVLGQLVYQRALVDKTVPKGLEDEAAFIAAWQKHNGLTDRVQADEFRRMAQSEKGFTLPPGVTEATSVAAAASAALTPEQLEAKRRDDALAAQATVLANMRTEVKNLREQKAKDAATFADSVKTLRGEVGTKAAAAAKAATEPLGKRVGNVESAANSAVAKADALDQRLAAVEGNPIIKWGTYAIGLLLLLLLGAYIFNSLTHRKLGRVRNEIVGGLGKVSGTTIEAKGIASEAQRIASDAKVWAGQAASTALEAKAAADKAIRLANDNLVILPDTFDQEVDDLAGDAEFRCQVAYQGDKGFVTVKRAPAAGMFYLGNVRDQTNAVSRRKLKKVIVDAARDGRVTWIADATASQAAA